MRLTLLYTSFVPLGAIMQVCATSLPREISPRQSTLFDSVPSACNTACSPIIKALDAAESCTTSKCICTSTNARYLETCVNCIVREVPNTLTAGKSVLSDFKTACSGVTLPSLTITASTASRTTTGTRTTTTSARTTSTRTTTTRTPTINPFPTQIFGNGDMFVSTSAAAAGATLSLVFMGATAALAVALTLL